LAKCAGESCTASKATGIYQEIRYIFKTSSPVVMGMKKQLSAAGKNKLQSTSLDKKRTASETRRNFLVDISPKSYASQLTNCDGNQPSFLFLIPLPGKRASISS
jgi:hypothetical protein